ncbi:hypothetical protein BHU72_09685 [Desulfuribacillus stibiiarsenatis]|uniref:Uncharacterized protein n=1 Tax=Desulfuribacillus stibiiarsenatis TaxID=1390249 RepID=A0A1E5L2V8_9FIRM|nr:thioesterase family protein [Desulfuribacillus stibiiarsenatis]OEH84468.1 hypothetical protein BHU72_09685 [Desulfuribacillus stibiiarsenatis]
MTGHNYSELRVRYQETDQMQVVYHSNYAIWFEVARTDFMRTHGISYKSLEEDGIMMPVVDLYCKYVKPAKYDDIVEIHTAIHDFTGVKLVFTYKVVHKERQELLATGYTTHALIQNGRPISIQRKYPQLARIIEQLWGGAQC